MEKSRYSHVNKIKTVYNQQTYLKRTAQGSSLYRDKTIKEKISHNKKKKAHNKQKHE